MPERADGLIRAFSMSCLQIVNDLQKIETDYTIDLEISQWTSKSRKISEYEQFEEKLRKQAAQMSEFYEIFYCLENSIRNLVKDAMIENTGINWWEEELADLNDIRKSVENRRKKEVDSGITPRSDDLIDYMTFGELSQLIINKWEIFEPIFVSKRAVEKVSGDLNLLRGPIAHCNPTDELEQYRLNLAVRSWFRIMS